MDIINCHHVKITSTVNGCNYHDSLGLGLLLINQGNDKQKQELHVKDSQEGLE